MSANIHSTQLLHTEVLKYKSLYEHEKVQLEEFQRYSKELEAEMDMEISVSNKQIVDLNKRNRILSNDLDISKRKQENEREQFILTENLLTAQLAASQQSCVELKHKLRVIEQINDDLERRERIQAQELIDLSVRFEKCLERCAYLEAGIFATDDNNFDSTPSITSNKITNSTSIVTETRQNTCSKKNCLVPDHINTSSIVKRFNLRNNVNNILQTEEKLSTEIVTNLFCKIEEMEKQVDPNKFIIHRTLKTNKNV